MLTGQSVNSKPMLINMACEVAPTNLRQTRERLPPISSMDTSSARGPWLLTVVRTATRIFLRMRFGRLARPSIRLWTRLLPHTKVFRFGMAHRTRQGLTPWTRYDMQDGTATYWPHTKQRKLLTN